MTEPILDTAALIALICFVLLGFRYGAFAALRWMLGCALALLAALRYWAPISQWFSGAHAPSAAVMLPSFWLPFLLVVYAFIKGCDDYIEALEPSEKPPVADRLLGSVFAAGACWALVAAVAMSLNVLAPRLFPEKAEYLPLGIEQTPAAAYRYVETRLAGIGPQHPARTLLPQTRDGAAVFR